MGAGARWTMVSTRRRCFADGTWFWRGVMIFPSRGEGEGPAVVYQTRISEWVQTPHPSLLRKISPRSILPPRLSPYRAEIPACFCPRTLGMVTLVTVSYARSSRYGPCPSEAKVSHGHDQTNASPHRSTPHPQPTIPLTPQARTSHQPHHPPTLTPVPHLTAHTLHQPEAPTRRHPKSRA